MVGHSALSMVVRQLFVRTTVTNAKVWASLAFSLVFLAVLHGASVLKVLFFLGCNYAVTRSLRGTRLGPLWVWVYGLALLFLNQAYQGYKFSSLWAGLDFLDSQEGLGVRWFITFNFSVLRMISFTMDYYWKSGATAESPFVVDNSLTDRERVERHHPEGDYGLLNYLAYTLYAPLYMAGPIITFNDFTHQVLQDCIVTAPADDADAPFSKDNHRRVKRAVRAAAPRLAGNNGNHAAPLLGRCNQGHQGLGRVHPAADLLRGVL
jgi:D-alanyl-lipoteichoic acid acyltransferase DltB (MBOAT superfamily)